MLSELLSLCGKVHNNSFVCEKSKCKSQKTHNQNKELQYLHGAQDRSAKKKFKKEIKKKGKGERGRKTERRRGGEGERGWGSGGVSVGWRAKYN